VCVGGCVGVFRLLLLAARAMLDCPAISQRGLTGEMSKYVPFLHSESIHLLPTQPTDTILALNES